MTEKAGLRRETFRQMLRYQDSRSIIKVVETHSGFGEHGWTVVFPLRPSNKVKRFWKHGTRWEAPFALAQIFSLKDHPYMYLLGFGRPAPQWNNLYRRDFVIGNAERLTDLHSVTWEAQKRVRIKVP